MSFARFSSDDYRSDVYVYVDGITDRFAIHVASGRHDVDVSDLPPTTSFDDPDGMFAEQWLERHTTLMEKIQESEFVEYEQEYAGESYTDLTTEEAVNFLQELQHLGYHIPDGTIEAVAEVATDDITA